MPRKRIRDPDDIYLYPEIKREPQPRVPISDFGILEKEGMDISWLSPRYAIVDCRHEIDPLSEPGKLFFSMAKTWTGVAMTISFTFFAQGYFPASEGKSKDTYWNEISKNLAKRGKNLTAPDLPHIVDTMMNPPPKFPLTRSVPKGAYMFTLILHFTNMLAHIRINKNDNA